VADSAGVVVDTVAPQLVTITRDATDPMAGRQDLNYTVTFDEDVSGVDASDFLLTATGNAHATIGAVSRVNGHTYVVTLQNVGGTGGLQLGLVADGSAVVDAAGNALAISANSAIELVGGVTPVIVPPSDSLPTAPNFHIDQASVGMLALTPVQRSELPTIFFGEAAPLRALDTSTHPIGGVLDGLMALADTQRALDAVARDSFVLPPVRVEAGHAFYVPLPGALAAADHLGLVQVVTSDGRALPAWLVFDPVAGALEGVVPRDFSGTLSLRVTVTDADGNVHSMPLELVAPEHADAKPAHAHRAAADSTANKPVPSAKPALQAQFGQQRQSGGIDHAALLQQLAVARQNLATAEARL
jgi:Putative Ig domain.